MWQTGTRRAARWRQAAAAVLGVCLLLIVVSCATAQGGVPYRSYCLLHGSSNASGFLLTYGYVRPTPAEIATGGYKSLGRFNRGLCGFTEGHELTLSWKSADGTPREEKVDLRELLPKTIDPAKQPGELFRQDPLSSSPDLKLFVDDKTLVVTFEATLRYLGERLPDGEHRIVRKVVRYELYRSGP